MQHNAKQTSFSIQNRELENFSMQKIIKAFVDSL
jgi:hypothetical protein